VLLAAGITRELGGTARARLVAAAGTAVASLVLVTGHLLSTSTFDLLAWTAIVRLAVQAVRRGPDRLWLLVGVVLGVALLNKPLPAFLAAALVAGVVISGPRRLLRSAWVWGGGVVALGLWTPWIVWQAHHGWPQLDVSRSIAAGNSASSQPWWALLPFQLLLVSPLLAPMWIAGLVALFRRPDLRDVRFLGWAWVVLAVLFTVTSGKPYYLGNLLPALVAVGALPTDAWLARRRGRVRTLSGAVAVSALVCATIALPLVPADDAGVVIAMNADVGETIGWPELVATVAAVDRRIGAPAGVVVFTENYGEAGAVDHYGTAQGLPHAYSGHNAYGDWGPPAAEGAPVIVVGYRPATAQRFFAGCRVAAHIHNDAGIDNDEDGAPVLVCARPRTSWEQEWKQLRHLG
jgi:4-amino-4-deoxy-L-arabinose transferase-like glycosyltransferase